MSGREVRVGEQVVLHGLEPLGHRRGDAVELVDDLAQLGPCGGVELGDEVDVEFPDGSTETFVLVHPLEASADEASISIESPLSRALLGRRPGERVTVEAPAGVYSCLLRARRRAD